MPFSNVAGTPQDSGISLETVLELGPTVPLFGVCMGLQCIGEAFGGGFFNIIIHTNYVSFGLCILRCVIVYTHPCIVTSETLTLGFLTLFLLLWHCREDCPCS